MIPSGVSWNVVDLVENNIRFRVTSPDGKSFFGWYPRFYFQDPAIIAQTSMGILQKQAGEVMKDSWRFVSDHSDWILNGWHERQRRRGNTVNNTTMLFDT
jgi:hypothetical protein